MKFIDRLFGYKDPEVDSTEDRIRNVLNEILGNKVENIYELTNNVKALIDPDDAPEKLRFEITRLKKQLSTAKNELADVKAQKVREEREVLHLVKIKKEQLEVESEKKTLKLQAGMKDKELEMQDNYFAQFIDRLDKQAAEMAGVHGRILDSLPRLENMVKVSTQTGAVSDEVIIESDG